MGQIKKGGLYAAYLRKSRADLEAEQQGQGETLARHRAILQATAQRLGIVIAQFYHEVVSGDTIAERPQVQAMLNDINSGKWDGILVVDIDRLGRGDSVDQGIIFQSFLYSNTLIVTPDKVYDPQDDSDAEFFEIKLFFSRREYNMIKKRMQRGRLQSAMAGCYMGSRPPFGYERFKLQHRKGWSIRPVPEKAAIVQMIFEWYLHGMNGRTVGCGVIADTLNQMGIKTDMGNIWRSSSIQHLLRDPAYIGKVQWNQRQTTYIIKDGIRTKIRPKSEQPLLIDGIHEGIIRPDNWQRAQDIMNGRQVTTTNRKHDVKSPFVGLIFCAVCGNPLSRVPDAVRGVTYMRCITPHCATYAASLTAVEDAVLATLQSWVDGFRADPETPTEIQQKPDNTDMIKQLTDQRKTVIGQMNRLYDLLEQGLYTVDLFTSRRAELSSRLSTIDEAIAGLTEDEAPADELSTFIPKVQTVLDAYHHAATASERNALLKTVIKRIDYHKTQRCYRNNLPGDYLTLDVYPVIPDRF